MTDSPKHKIALLAVTLPVFFLAGCSLFGNKGDPMETLREQVRETVSDPARAEDMVATVDRIDQLLVDIGAAVGEAARRERLLFRDYDSTPQDYEALFSETLGKRRELQEATLDAHLDFKEKATAEEWRILLPLHARAISLRVESLVADAMAGRG